MSNSNGQAPFLPLGYVPQPQTEVPRPYVPKPEVDGIHCPLCEEPFEFDEDTVDIARGRMRRSRKTGRLITSDPATDGPPAIITVHSQCLIEYWVEHEDADGDGGETFWNLVDERAEELAKEWLGDREIRERLERRLADPRS